jgi:D-alanyl-lipoteichoic acid acyltransferase DltB (MBOAT superfamily)
MLFNSINFIFIFLPVVLFGFYIAGKYRYYKVATIWLVITSLFFYGWWNPYYLILIIGSIIFNFVVGRSLCVRQLNSNPKYILIFGITTNLLLIAYYKYANFFIDSLNILINSSYHIDAIILPLAISFFTFQQITYLVDAYRGETRDHDFLHYCLFVLFFPQLIAGPIVHHSEMLPQFSREKIYKFCQRTFAVGLSIFLIGLFKKVVLADGAAVYASPVFSASEEGVVITFFEAWSAALGYTFQLYFDFSGYSDMAIGIARMFGIKLPINFNSPYKAVNIIEFWRRWHITLSRFLRDYLYFPLGGNRKGSIRRYVNLFITMLLGGLWHGAGWTFVIWGVLHGSYLIINHAWHALKRKLINQNSFPPLIAVFLSRIITLFAIIVAWVVFRAETFDGAVNILQGMFGFNGVFLPAQIASQLPGVESVVGIVGSMPLLGGGTVMGILEMLALFFLMSVIIFSPNVYELSNRIRLIILMATLYFTIQSVLFSRIPSEFLYFQF